MAWLALYVFGVTQRS